MSVIFCTKDIPIAWVQPVQMVLRSLGLGVRRCDDLEDLSWFIEQHPLPTFILVHHSVWHGVPQIPEELRKFVSVFLFHEGSSKAMVKSYSESGQNSFYVPMAWNISSICNTIVLLVKTIKKQMIMSLEVLLPFTKEVFHFSIYSPQDKENGVRQMLHTLELWEQHPENPKSIWLQNAQIIMDELLLNAIFHANPRLSNVPRSHPFRLGDHEKVNVRWAFDGYRLGMEVTDPFGTLAFEDLFKPKAQIKEPLNAASDVTLGIGFKTLFRLTEGVWLTVVPGSYTRVCCTVPFWDRLLEFQKMPKFVYFNVC